jgi:hypothetical protein
MKKVCIHTAGAKALGAIRTLANKRDAVERSMVTKRKGEKRRVQLKKNFFSDSVREGFWLPPEPQADWLLLNFILGQIVPAADAFKRIFPISDHSVGVWSQQPLQMYSKGNRKT